MTNIFHTFEIWSKLQIMAGTKAHTVTNSNQKYWLRTYNELNNAQPNKCKERILFQIRSPEA